MSNTHKLVVERPVNGRTVMITSWFDSEEKAAAAADNVPLGEAWTISTKEGTVISSGTGTKEVDPNTPMAPRNDPRMARQGMMERIQAARGLRPTPTE